MNTVNTMFKVMHDCYGSVILWDCVTSSDSGNLQCMEGEMNSFKYQRNFGENIMPPVMVSTSKYCYLKSFKI